MFYGQGGAAFSDLHVTNMQRADSAFFGSGGDGGPGISTPAGTSPRNRRFVQPAQEENFIGEIVNSRNHSQGDVLTGWYGGGGVAFLLTNIVSVGVDFKHVEFGDQTEHLTTGHGPVFPGNTNIDLSGDQITFQVNFKIGSMPFGGQ
jgi:opacity protein-like surface antigen